MTTTEFKPFERRISDQLLAAISNESLFTGPLKADIHGSAQTKSSVFPTIRQARMDFYHQGGKLFSYNKTGFCTHLKYALGVDEVEKLRPEIRESDLPHLKHITSFASGYPSIKALCSLHAGDEARTVSQLWGQFSFAVPGNEVLPVVVLDVEASFDARARDDASNDQDRIDLVLLNTLDRSLLFVEAKLFGNSALRASEGAEPEIVGQIARYKEQVAQQELQIIKAYSQYVRAMNRLFELSLPEPESILCNVPLLIVDFDGDQREGRLSLNKQALAQHHICCLSIGNLAAAKPNTLKRWYEKARCPHVG